MAVLRKFRAFRPKVGLEKEVASFPYDVINSEEAREIANGNPNSFLHIVKPEIDLPKDINLYEEKVYQKAKENVEKFINEEILVQEDTDRLYIYRQVMDGREQYGLVGCCSADDYLNDVIKKHEHTRKVKEEDRIKHVDTTNINSGPIFLTYKSNDRINDLVANCCQKKPLYDFVSDDGIGHTVWVIEDDNISNELITIFEKIEYLYVADGHHRSASAAKTALKRRENNSNHTGNEEYNYFLSVLFPDTHLYVMDYNRVLKDLNGHTEEEFFAKLSDLFTWEKIGAEPHKPAKKGEFGMYYKKEWYKLNINPELIPENDPVNSLDTASLQLNLLKPFFGIEDPRKSDNIDFIGGIRGLKELEKRVNSGEWQVAFSMYPTTIKELMDIADAGEVMPPKSTWFEPKLRSGLLVHHLEK